MCDNCQEDVFGEIPVTPRVKHKVRKVRGEVACRDC